MDASKNNDNVHIVGLTPSEVSVGYSQWARQYETDLCESNFRGPVIVTDAMTELFPEPSTRTNLRVLDVAAGTGFVGQRLQSAGFASVDALEPSEGMMSVLREKQIYKHTYSAYLDGSNIGVPDDSYDVAAISGGMGEGHIPCKGLPELTRLVKPGGYVLIAMREAYLTTVTEYKDKLEPFMNSLEKEGAWKMVSRKVVPNYSFTNNGIVYTFKIL